MEFHNAGHLPGLKAWRLAMFTAALFFVQRQIVLVSEVHCG